MTRADLIRLAALALAVRAAHLLFLWATDTGFMIEDSSLYVTNAEWLMRTGEFLTGPLDEPRLDTERMYGFTLVIAVMGWITGGAPVAGLLLLQTLADTITVLCVACAAGRMGRGVGIVAGLLAAVWPNMVLHSGLVLADTVALSLIALTMLGFVRFAERPGWRRALTVGLALGASLSIRQGLLPLVPVIALAMGYAAYRTRSLSSAAGFALIPLALVALFLFPQAERHWDRTGRVVLTAQTGPHFLYWVAAEAAATLQGGSRSDWAARYDAEADARAAARGGELDPFEMSALRTELAFEKMGEMPLAGLAGIWIKSGTVNLFAPSLAFHPWVRAQKSGSFDRDATGSGLVAQVRGFLTGQPSAYLAVVLPALAAAALTGLFAGIGLVASFRRYPGMCLIGVGFVAYVLVLTGPVIGAKYALPADPVLIVWTAAGLCTVVGFLRRQSSKGSIEE